MATTWENICSWTNGMVFIQVRFRRTADEPDTSLEDDQGRLNALCQEKGYLRLGMPGSTNTPNLKAMCVVVMAALPRAIRVEVRHGNSAMAVQNEYRAS